MGIGPKGVHYRDGDGKGGLPQPEIVYYITFFLKVFTSIVYGQRGGLAITADIYVQANVFLKIHFLPLVSWADKVDCKLYLIVMGGTVIVLIFWEGIVICCSSIIYELIQQTFFNMY